MPWPYVYQYCDTSGQNDYTMLCYHDTSFLLVLIFLLLLPLRLLTYPYLYTRESEDCPSCTARHLLAKLRLHVLSEA